MTLPKRIKNPFKTSEEKLITAIEQQYNQLGRLPFCQELLDLGAVGSSEEYTALINSPYVQKALETLGIFIDPSIPILEPLQLAAIQVMFDFHDGRSSSKKLRDLGISGQTWQNWLRDPVFQKFCQDKAESLFTINSHEVDQALFLKARTGQVDAIKLYMQLTGKLRQAEPPKIGAQDGRYVIVRISEAIEEVLADHPDLLRALGAKIRAIANPFLTTEERPAIENNLIPDPIVVDALQRPPMSQPLTEEERARERHNA